MDVSHCYADIRKNSSHGYRWCDTYYDKLPPLLQRGKPIIQLNNNKQIINIFILLGLTQALSHCYDKTIIHDADSLKKAAQKELKNTINQKPIKHKKGKRKTY